MNWLVSILEFYEKSNPVKENRKYSFDDLYEFYYEEEAKYNEHRQIVKRPNAYGTIFDVFKHSLKLTEEVILPVLDAITDLDSCVEYFHKFRLPMRLNNNDDDFVNRDKLRCDNEGLLYVKTGKYGYYMERKREMQLNSIANKINAGIAAFFTDSDGKHHPYTQEIYEEHRRKFEQEKPQRMVRYNQIYEDREWYAKALAELERRKITNIEALRSYGLYL